MSALRVDSAEELRARRWEIVHRLYECRFRIMVGELAEEALARIRSMDGCDDALKEWQSYCDSRDLFGPYSETIVVLPTLTRREPGAVWTTMGALGIIHLYSFRLVVAYFGDAKPSFGIELLTGREYETGQELGEDESHTWFNSPFEMIDTLVARLNEFTEETPNLESSADRDACEIEDRALSVLENKT